MNLTAWHRLNSVGTRMLLLLAPFTCKAVASALCAGATAGGTNQARLSEAPVAAGEAAARQAAADVEPDPSPGR